MRKTAILCIAAAIALLAPATALAEIFRQEGQIVGDSTTSVKLRVDYRDGKAKKVAGFKAKNVVVRCDKGPDRINFTALTPVKVDADNSFKVRLSDGKSPPGILRITGKVKNNGRATVGSLKTNDFQSDGQTCRAPKQRFKTST